MNRIAARTYCSLTHQSMHCVRVFRHILMDHGFKLVQATTLQNKFYTTLFGQIVL